VNRGGNLRIEAGDRSSVIVKNTLMEVKNIPIFEMSERVGTGSRE